MYDPISEPEYEAVEQDGLAGESACPKTNNWQVYRRIKRVSHRRPLRALALRLLTEGPGPVDDVAQLLSGLTDMSLLRRADREVGLWALGQARLTPAQRGTCARELSNFIESTLQPGGGERIWRCLKRSYITTCTIFGTAIFLSLLGHIADGRGALPAAGLVMMTIVLLAVMTVFMALFFSPLVMPFSLILDKRARARARPAVTALGNLYRFRPGQAVTTRTPVVMRTPTGVQVGGGATWIQRYGTYTPRSVGTLAAAHQERLTRAEAAQALQLALPHLGTEHYGTLDRQTIPRLCRALSDADVDLGLRILEALEKVGDARAIPAVQRLITSRGDAVVRQSAERVLDVLIHREEMERSSQVLLRAASEPVGQEMLLRAAAQGHHVDPGQLLRGSTTETPPEGVSGRRF